ncbi:F-box only protein 22-like [Bacillus rossius redtenbacheri]|uniref:F-box only protein 22-like n=1 Tax=Bacillus rossius redtenbacheri TaxID=93214 RepID=UPI002FDEA78D
MDIEVESSDVGAEGRAAPGKRQRSPPADEASSQKTRRARRDSGTHMIFSQYEVVRTILGHLPREDVRSAAQVCSTWNSVAKIVLQSRMKAEWVLASTYPALETFLRTQLAGDPRLCLVFLMKMKKSLVACLRKHVGPACAVVEVQGSGIVGSPAGSLEARELEGRGRKGGISALLLPSVPGVACRTFKIPGHVLAQVDEVDLTPEEVRARTSIDPTDDVKCLLLFSDCCSAYMKRLALSVRRRQANEFVLAGGLCSMSCRTIAGVALAGPNVVAASMLLPSDVMKTSAAEKYFQEFRRDTKDIDAKQTVGLMFACVGRGKSMYNEPNVEASLFRKYFPSTPLVGFFGFGEIGADFVPDGREARSVTDEYYDEYFRDYCTVFVYLAFT